jgi:hypothetical protein
MIPLFQSAADAGDPRFNRLRVMFIYDVYPL